MATTKTKKTTATKKTGSASKTKKADTLKQIENLEKALEKVNEDTALNLVPEEVKADIFADKENLEELETPTEVDFDAEVKKIIETAEPSEELKEQLKDVEEMKEAFNEKIEKEPENAEKIVQEEIKKVEALKKKAEALKKSIQKSRPGNEGFTNWWNGSSNLY